MQTVDKMQSRTEIKMSQTKNRNWIYTMNNNQQPNKQQKTNLLRTIYVLMIHYYIYKNPILNIYIPFYSKILQPLESPV